jgi:hypothetical protein
MVAIKPASAVKSAQEKGICVRVVVIRIRVIRVVIRIVERGPEVELPGQHERVPVFHLPKGDCLHSLELAAHGYPHPGAENGGV